MNAPAFCPHCGADIRLDQPICLNDFSMFGDGYPLYYQQQPIILTSAQSAICWSLLKAFPRMVRRDALINRMGSDSLSNAVEVQVSRIRDKLRQLGVPNPIETVQGKGYRWTLDPEGAPIQRNNGGGRPKRARASDGGQDL
jgi:DNA-binding response OmpR family regulator